MRLHPRFQGFTLIELIVTLSIAAILLSVAVPSYQATVVNNRLATDANRLLADLALARSEAVKRGTRVTLCKSADGAACTTAGAWQQGWVVFNDLDNDAILDAGTETILRVTGGLKSGATLTGTGATANYVSYVGSGFSQLVAGGFLAGTLTLCRNAHSRLIVLSNTGRARLESGTC